MSLKLLIFILLNNTAQFRKGFFDRGNNVSGQHFGKVMEKAAKKALTLLAGQACRAVVMKKEKQATRNMWPITDVSGMRGV